MFSYKEAKKKLEQTVCHEYLLLADRGFKDARIADMLDINPRTLTNIKISNGLVVKQMPDDFWIDVFKTTIKKIEDKGEIPTAIRIAKYAGCSSMKAFDLMRKYPNIFIESTDRKYMTQPFVYEVRDEH